MTKVLVVFGTRPEAIKMAPLIKEFENHKNLYNLKVCVTAQHREMLDQVLELFGITPDFDLDIMTKGQDLYDVNAKVLLGLRDVFKLFLPDLVLVHGDTATSTAAATAAFFSKIPVGHVEAGLRTNNIYSPWPEEINRQMTSRISTFHFAPTVENELNLLNENISNKNTVVTGNTGIDALKLVLKKIESEPDLQEKVLMYLETSGIPLSVVRSWTNGARKMILVTGHRRENFGEGFIDICKALQKLVSIYKDIDILYPVHLNPNVSIAIEKVFGQSQTHDNLFFIPPVDYLPFVYLMNLAAIILTDSGGIQEEAPSLLKPVLVMRDTTERPEAIKAGTAKLVGANMVKIINAVTEIIDNKSQGIVMQKNNNPYGDGNASKKIINYLTDWYSNQSQAK